MLGISPLQTGPFDAEKKMGQLGCGIGWKLHGTNLIYRRPQVKELFRPRRCLHPLLNDLNPSIIWWERRFVVLYGKLIPEACEG